jgi:hypothetical protein
VRGRSSPSARQINERTRVDGPVLRFSEQRFAARRVSSADARAHNSPTERAEQRSTDVMGQPYTRRSANVATTIAGHPLGLVNPDPDPNRMVQNPGLVGEHVSPGIRRQLDTARRLVHVAVSLS